MLIHDTTLRQLDITAEQKTQSILLVGEQGSGKSFAARYVIAKLLGVSPEKVADHPYVLAVKPLDGKSVKIDQIREIKHFLRLSVPGVKRQINRCILIEAAETMSVESQNAALKLIEEPTEDTAVIILAPREQDVLPTIRSRCQIVSIRPIPESMALKYASERGFDTKIARKQYMLSGGLVGLYLALLSNDQDHPLLAAIQEAKAILSGAPFDRIVAVEHYSKDKEALQHLLFALDRIAESGLRSSAQSGSVQDRWREILQSLETADKQLAVNVNTKLVVTNLMLAL